MALATQCPHCFTIFRVASDQLKLRGGLVRCGSCKQVFNGNEFLVEAGISDGFYHPAPGSKAQEPGMTGMATPATPIAPTAPAVPAFDTSVLPAAVSATLPEVNVPAPAVTPITELPPAPATAAIPAAPTVPAAPPPPSQPPIPLEAEPKVFRSPTTPGYIPDLGTMHKLPPAPVPDADGFPLPTTPSLPLPGKPDDAFTVHDPDALAHLHAAHDEPLYADAAHDEHDVDTAPDIAEADDQVLDHDPEQPLTSDTTTEASEAIDEEEDADTGAAPGFVQRAQRRERIGNLTQMVLVVLSALLIPVLLLQATYYWRNQIAAAAPVMRPMLNGMCVTFGCTVGLPADISRLSLESNELQVVPPNQNVYALSLVLRNRDSEPQAWPAIELTLNNDDEKPVVRRVFRPRDYLSSPAQIDNGIGGQSEQPLKISFELDDAVVSGYRIYLFYP